MNLQRYFETDDRGVSPVIGVILMVAITVILAAVIATFVMNLGPPEDQAPTTSWSTSSDGIDVSASDAVTFTHDGGEEVDGGELSLKVSGAGNNSIDGTYAWTTIGGPDPVSASDSATFDSADTGASSIDLSSASVKLVWESSQADKSQTLKTWEP